MAVEKKKRGKEGKCIRTVIVCGVETVLTLLHTHKSGAHYYTHKPAHITTHNTTHTILVHITTHITTHTSHYYTHTPGALEFAAYGVSNHTPTPRTLLHANYYTQT